MLKAVDETKPATFATIKPVLPFLTKIHDDVPI